MFVDQADIQVFAGDGGNGCLSFRREKYIPHGGPDGGDGGDGGSVYLEAVPGVDTLLDMVGRHHWYANRGAHGKGKKQAGKDGEDLVIRVPPGTLIYDRDSGLLLADLKADHQKVRIAKGGRGGKGNIFFVTSVHQAPDHAEPGGKGEIRNLHLELRMIADVGLVGMPNAGKSTLLSRLSAARPKIADYPFTTLVPQLGIAELDAERRLVIADIPGLIEGASTGHGLGQDFLRHIERTRVIVHLIDILPIDSGGGGATPIEAYRQIRAELKAYSPKLAAKPEIVVANKMDLSGASEALADLRDALPGRQIFAISGVAGTGLRPLLETLWQQVEKAPASEPFVDAPHVIAPKVSAQELREATTLEEDVRAHAAESAAKMPDPVRAPRGPRTTKAQRLAKSISRKQPAQVAVPAAKTPEKPKAKKGAASVKKPALKKPALKKPALKAVPARKPSTARVAVPVELENDPELAAEIAAMKADDQRKGKYYRRGKA